ncbi:sphingosine kinase, putative [Entamoeba invadens IP1]|uniref:Sphingosine kinase, putative n=1 Tax=Entamoeba invadens IP1 TaxID=370355 RepID=A0A0A1TYB4_ENTIV|nr:sphingosine kinase, putative [Entamoeba invadens IP1]ELP84535.1 sphingosine kinase, putative [Entamoeba invadens IP1]|eukprot:XP_004183881.1 sphingosine kinase, putative [Entamoeba invadens IP1]
MEKATMITVGLSTFNLNDICLYKYTNGVLTVQYLVPNKHTKVRKEMSLKISQDEFKEFKTTVDASHTYPSLFFLINPFSGTGKGVSIFKGIEEYLQCMGVKYAYEITERENHESEIITTRTDIDDFDTIVVGGGDGSLSNVINSSMNRPSNDSRIISPLPCGSGNGIAYSLYHDDNPLTAMCHIVCGKVTRMDGLIVDHLDINKQYYGILEFEVSYLSSIDFASECIRWLGAFRFILWTLWYCVKLMCTKMVVKVKKVKMENFGSCGALCKKCVSGYNENITYDYTKNIATQIINRHTNPDAANAECDGWETLADKSFCILFLNNCNFGMPGIEFAHNAHRNDGLMDNWILSEKNATRLRFLGFWICAVLNVFVPKYVSGFDYFRSSAMALRLEKEDVLGFDGERLPPGKNFNIYVAPSVYRIRLCTL